MNVIRILILLISSIRSTMPSRMQSVPVQAVMTDIVPMIYNAGMSIISWIINIILAFVISCYLMSSKHRIIHGMKRIIYALFDQRPPIRSFLQLKNATTSLVSISSARLWIHIIGIICFVLMCILKLQYALLISIVVGITNMIPYFGPFIGAIPGLIILLIISPKQALIFLILILLLQQFDGTILGPKILGDSTGLSPIWIIFAITSRRGYRRCHRYVLRCSDYRRTCLSDESYL